MPTPPLPYPGTPYEQQMVKDEGVAIGVARGESGLGRGDYAAHRRESSLLSHKAVSSAVREFPFQPFPTVPANRTLISTRAVTGCGNKYPPSGKSRSRPDI